MFRLSDCWWVVTSLIAILPDRLWFHWTLVVVDCWWNSLIRLIVAIVRTYEGVTQGAACWYRCVIVLHLSRVRFLAESRSIFRKHDDKKWKVRERNHQCKTQLWHSLSVIKPLFARVMGKMRPAEFCGLLVWQKVEFANPNTNPIPNTDPNFISNPTKLQARILPFAPCERSH